MAANDDLAAIVQSTTSKSALESLEPHSQLRFHTMMMGFHIYIDFAYHQYLAGLLDESTWKPDGVRDPPLPPFSRDCPLVGTRQTTLLSGVRGLRRQEARDHASAGGLGDLWSH